MSLRAKQITSVDDDKASCYQAVALQAKSRKCVTRGYLYCSSLDIQLEALSLFAKQRKPVNCSLGLIRLFWCRVNCVQLKPLLLTYNSQVRPNSAIIVVHFLILLAGWLLRDERGEICLLPFLVFAGQEKPLTAVLQHLNLPGIQPEGQVQQTEAFKHKASLERSQRSRLWAERLQGNKFRGYT